MEMDLVELSALLLSSSIVSVMLLHLDVEAIMTLNPAL